MIQAQSIQKWKLGEYQHKEIFDFLPRVTLLNFLDRLSMKTQKMIRKFFQEKLPIGNIRDIDLSSYAQFQVKDRFE